MHDVVDGDGAGVGRGAVAVAGVVVRRDEPQAAVVKAAHLGQDPEMIIRTVE